MSIVYYIAALLGALGVYWTLPHDRSMPRPGAVLAAGALAIALIAILSNVRTDSVLTTVHMGLFSFIAAAAALRVITHKRPVFSALYFVLVVLSTSGMLVLLEAEFMAFAMVIIYGGAILITYMFVIMLATLPQTSAEADSGPVYDRFAREPVMAVVMGFTLIAVLTSVIQRSNTVDYIDAEDARDTSVAQVERSIPTRIAQPHKVIDKPGALAVKIPGKIRVDDVGENTRRVTELERLLRARGQIGAGEHVWHVGAAPAESEAHLVAQVATSEGAARRSVELDDAILGRFVSNIDHVGLNLFQGHTLGIELAAIILLLSMVGAIVIARQKIPESPNIAT